MSDVIVTTILFITDLLDHRLFTGYDGHKKKSVTVKPSDHKAQLAAWLVHADAVLSRMWLLYCAGVDLFCLFSSFRKATRFDV